jgi:NADH dehydrogenase
MGGQLLTPFKPVLRDYAKRALEELGVQVHLGESVVAVESEIVHLASGGSFPAHTLVWAAGLTSPSLARSLGQEMPRGRIAPEAALNLKDHPEVFVIGDLAAIRDEDTGDTLAQLGSVAQQAGTHAGASISRLVAGKQPKPFSYKDKGTMAMIGKGAAIVQLRSGRTMTGQAAWLAWLGVHLMLLSGPKQKGRTLVDWGRGIVGKGRSRAA